jgi:hypothetical protein
MANTGGKNQKSMNAAIQKLKMKAASLGANGMVIININTSTVWVNNWPVDETDLSGKAFYVENVPVTAMPLKTSNDLVKNDFPKFETTKIEADNGNLKAKYYLGIMYANGLGVEKNSDLALQWYKKAAEQATKLAQGENAEAQYMLGLMYANARGLPKDSAKALYWYQKAAEQGVMDAEYALVLHFDQSDPAESLKWTRKAAEQGYGDAQYHLGFLYENGISVPKDYVESYKWFNLASVDPNGFQAKEALKKLEANMTREQIGEAQQLSRDFKANK